MLKNATQQQKGVFMEKLAIRLEENYSAAKTMMENMWWKPEYDNLFTEDFTIELPYAPPGMNQYMCVGQTLAHKFWLNRTVKDWHVRDMKLYGPRDPFGDKFICIRYAGGNVHWGGQDGVFESRHISLMTIKDGKISHLKEWANPIEYLKGANVEVPVFLQEFDEEKAAKRLENQPARPKYDMSPEAIQKRAYDNVHSFIELNFFEAVKKRTYSETYHHAIWNAPPNMLEQYPKEKYHVFDQWIDDSLTREWHGHPDIIPYATDDPHVFFFESGGYGLAEWIGNNTVGGYANRYMKYLELDDAGFIQCYDETLSPISKMNSINKPLPAFPYMF